MSDPKHDAVAVVERHEIERMHPVVAAMMAKSPDPATLRELLEVQREWEKGEARRAYMAALVDLKRDLPTVIRRDTPVDFTGKAGRVHYRHASMAAVMDAITEPLTRHGFTLSWPSATPQPGVVTVTARLDHSAGHHEENTISAPPDNSGLKNPAQAVCSTMTMLSRYAALALLGIATADMPESIGEQTPPDPAAIDSARNLRAVEAIRKAGRTCEDAEKLTGRPPKDWTAADLDKLRAWLAPAQPVADPPHNPETGEVIEAQPPPPAPPEQAQSAARLAEALGVMDLAKTEEELKSLVVPLRKIKLTDEHRGIARARYKSRLAAVRAQKPPERPTHA